MEVKDLILLIIGYGVLGAFCVALLEKLVPVVPSYLILLMLGAGAPDIHTAASLIFATAAGSSLATACWYIAGRALGETRVKNIVSRYGKVILLRPHVYERLANAYRRNHFWVTLIGQTVPVARVYLALPAGVLKIPPSWFFIAAAIGIHIYNASFVLIGFALSEANYDPMISAAAITIALIAIEIAVALGLRNVKRNRPPSQICKE